MPIEFDPAWEYRVIPQEIEEAGLFPRAAGFTGLVDQDRKNRSAAAAGFRFGASAAALNRTGFRLGRPRRVREYNHISPRECRGCGRIWTPDRAGRTYCSFACVYRPGGIRVRPLSRECPGCRRPFEPARVGQVYCSRKCGGGAAAGVSPVTVRKALPGAVEMFDAGITSNEIARALGVAPSTVRRHLASAGRVMNRPGRPRGKK